MTSVDTVDLVRSASRQLVRELGFMRRSLAGTDLPPSAVHALIEIEARDGITAGELAERLVLEKSSVSRMLRKLILSGDVIEEVGPVDGRTKRLSLSGQGRSLVAKIHRFARAQVAEALDRLTPSQRSNVVEGLQDYAAALSIGGSRHAVGRPPIRIETGYSPGLIGGGTILHASYYAQVAGFGRPFEAMVASGLAEFSGRLDRPCNAVWRAMRDGRIVGMIAIDGEDLGPGIAHLRWFIVDAEIRGRGVGRELLALALRFSDERGFFEIGCGRSTAWMRHGISMRLPDFGLRRRGRAASGVPR